MKVSRSNKLPLGVEGYVFPDSGFGYPLFQGMMSHGSG